MDATGEKSSNVNGFLVKRLHKPYPEPESV